MQETDEVAEKVGHLAECRTELGIYLYAPHLRISLGSAEELRMLGRHSVDKRIVLWMLLGALGLGFSDERIKHEGNVL